MRFLHAKHICKMQSRPAMKGSIDKALDGFISREIIGIE